MKVETTNRFSPRYPGDYDRGPGRLARPTREPVLTPISRGLRPDRAVSCFDPVRTGSHPDIQGITTKAGRLHAETSRTGSHPDIQGITTYRARTPCRRFEPVLTPISRGLRRVHFTVPTELIEPVLTPISRGLRHRILLLVTGEIRTGSHPDIQGITTNVIIGGNANNYEPVLTPISRGLRPQPHAQTTPVLEPVLTPISRGLRLESSAPAFTAAEPVLTPISRGLRHQRTTILLHPLNRFSPRYPGDYDERFSGLVV